MEIKKCVTSFGFGKRKKTLEITKPLFEEYAHKVGADFVTAEASDFDEWILSQKEFSWSKAGDVCLLKIPHLIKLLDEYDQVLWLDADVIVTGFDNVFGAMDAPMRMVLNKCDAGEFCNTGVWLVEKKAKDFICSIEINKNVAKGAKWYGPLGYDGEMPMVLNALGVDLMADVISMPLSQYWCQMDYKFHNIKHDYRGYQKNAVFVHACSWDIEIVMSLLITAGIWDLQKYIEVKKGK